VTCNLNYVLIKRKVLGVAVVCGRLRSTLSWLSSAMSVRTFEPSVRNQKDQMRTQRNATDLREFSHKASHSLSQVARRGKNKSFPEESSP